MRLTRPYRGPRMWTTDLFECCEDPTSCAEATCCPWCSVAAQHNRLTRGAPGVDSLCCLMLCLSDSCLTCGFLTMCTNMKYRSEIQRRYGIMEDECQNCLASMCCLPCAITQQYREMCYRSIYPGGLCVSPPIGTPMGFPAPVASSPQLIILQHVPVVPPPPPPTYAVVTVAPMTTYGAYSSPTQQQAQPVYGYPQPAPNQYQPQPYYGQPLQPAPNQYQQQPYYGNNTNNNYYSPRAVDAVPQGAQPQAPPYAQNQQGYAKEY